MDLASFRDVMAGVPGPVAVVTASTPEGEHRGLTMTAVCSVSAAPPLVLACIDLTSNTLPAVRASRSFTVNFLAEGRDELALRFASKQEEKFAGLSWGAARTGVGGPVLYDDVAGYVACSVAWEIPAGDHVVFIGEVLEGDVQPPRSGLAYCARRFFSAPAPAGGVLAAGGAS